jgi:hypothetical protein
LLHFFGFCLHVPLHQFLILCLPIRFNVPLRQTWSHGPWLYEIETNLLVIFTLWTI